MVTSQELKFHYSNSALYNLSLLTTSIMHGYGAIIPILKVAFLYHHEDITL